MIKCTVRLRYESRETDDQMSVVQLMYFSDAIISATLDLTFSNILGRSFSDRYLLDGRV